MPYSAQISRTNPACVLFLIDQSRSMDEPISEGSDETKAMLVADALNRLIQNIVLRSAKSDGVRDYFRVGVIGYGKRIRAGLGGSLPFGLLIPISRVSDKPLRVESRTKLVHDGSCGVVEQTVKFPVWFDPIAGGPTPMSEAFAAAGLAVKGFIDEFPHAYPPIVLNLTDGLPSDGNPQGHARMIRKMSTTDGNALVFNLQFSKTAAAADYFPATEEFLSDTCAKLLFRMASPLPPKLREIARSEGHLVQPEARGVVINADATAVIRFLDIGTRLTLSDR